MTRKPKLPAVPDSVAVVMLPLEEVHPYENNPRNNSKQVASLARSIQQYGFTQPIVVDGARVVIMGHTRLMAAERIGLDLVPCVVREDLTQLQVRELRILDNRLGEQSTWDEGKLLAEFREIMAAGGTVEKAGFDHLKFERLLAQSIADNEGEPEVEFTREMGACTQYVVLMFDNEVDWVAAKQYFGLKQMQEKKSDGKTWSRQGIGRILDGGEYLARVMG
jgi:hypothetical protein